MHIEPYSIHHRIESAYQYAMSRQQCIMHAWMILTELDKVDRILDQTIAKMKEAAMGSGVED